ncbi:MAG: lipopolysaccharide biosynthesis protein [Pirellula sp.]
MSLAISQPATKSLKHGESHAADSLVSGLSFMLVANMIQRGVGFVRNIVLCRLLTDEHLGLWALASSFFVLAAPLAVLGLPGTFGRLVESYRLSGQLNVFLRRVAGASLIGVSLCAVWLVVASGTSSQLIFGTELSCSTMALVSLTLCLVILFNAMTELLSGLRMPRTVSAMHTSNSLSFTAASLGGLMMINDWRILIVAFAVSACVGLLPAVPAFRNWEEIAPSTNQTRITNRDMWRRVLPFAVSVWCMNLLINLFEVVDRYMLLYLATESAEQGRALVGQFHSGRIMPVLLSSLTLMLSGLLLPYLAAEWESGGQKSVARSLRLTFKCSMVFFYALAVGSLAVSPILFEFVLAGKYADGMSIMPQALVHCCLAGLAFLMQNYFWCAERGKTVGIIILVGLVTNVLLNSLWVPVSGLHGAMLATTVSGAIILAMTLAEIHRSGVRLGAVCYLFAVLPVTLILGIVPSAFILAAILLVTGRSNWLFSDEEKRVLDEAITPKLQNLGISVSSVLPETSR